jgi:hypothetical protein
MTEALDPDTDSDPDPDKTVYRAGTRVVRAVGR